MFMKSIVIAVGCCLISLGSKAQNEMQTVLQEIEKNNLEIQAMKALQRSKEEQLRATNNLSDPQIEGFYLPFGNHNTGDYTEIQISQDFQFPTVYSNRKKLIEKQIEYVQIDVLQKRQDILLQASNLCLEMVQINQKIERENARIIQSKKVYDITQALYKSEQIGILDLNKAKIAWMQDQFRLQQLENDKIHLLHELTQLNGGKEITINQKSFNAVLELPSKDSIWSQKYDSDPYFMALQKKENIAHQQIQLARNGSLPNLTAGFNQQGVAGAYYSGVYLGVSIPLWSNRHVVSGARAELDYQHFQTLSLLQLYQKELDGNYQQYEHLLQKYKEYQVTLNGIESEELLLKAYELGQLTFLQYHMELQFYREAIDVQMQVEYQLQRTKNELLKHQL